MKRQGITGERIVDGVVLKRRVGGERGDCLGYAVWKWKLGSMGHMSRLAWISFGLGAASWNGEALDALDAWEGRTGDEEYKITMVWLAVDGWLF